MENRNRENKSVVREKLTFADTAKKGVEAIEGKGNFEDEEKFGDVRLETIKRFLELLKIEEASVLAGEIIDRRYNVDEIIRIWEKGGSAGLKLYFALLREHSGEKEGEDHEKDNEVYENNEDFEDTEPRLSRSSGKYVITIKNKKRLLNILIERGLISNTSESVDFWNDFLEETENLDGLINTFLKG